MRSREPLMIFALAALLIGVQADAALVSYSFTSNDTLTNQTGAGVIGGASDQWMTEFVPIDTNARAVDDIALTDVNGDPTTATLSHLGLRRHNSAGQVLGGGNPVPLQSSVYMRHAVDPSRMYLFEGLLPGSTADLVLFSTYHLTGIDRGSSFTIGGDTKSTVGNGSRGVLEDGRNYVRFDNLVVGPSGQIEVEIAGNNTNFSDVNGFQIEFTGVPEPASCGVAVMACLVAIGRRRRV